MANSFTPLTSTTPSPASSAPVGQSKPVTILAKTQAVSLCAPLFNHEKRSNVPRPPAPVSPHPPPPAPGFNALSPQRHESHIQPQITFQRQGDQITQIRIQCSCGQVFELNCEY